MSSSEQDIIVSAKEVDSTPVQRSTQVAVVENCPPSIPFPPRTGNTAIIPPRYIYIRDGAGRYLTYRPASSSLYTLTFEERIPDSECIFETIAQQAPSTFRLYLPARSQWIIVVIDGVVDETWYSVAPGNIPFLFIHAQGNIVYLQNLPTPQRFMSSQLTSSGSPRGLAVINQNCEMEITIAAAKREIIDIHYDIPGGQVREAPPLIALSTTVRNDSDGDVEQTLEYTYQKWSVGTWNNTAGIEIGVSTSFKAGIPFVFSANFEISVTAAYLHEWGGEQGTLQEVKSSTKVIVPPKKKARAIVTVRNAQIDVGFTYTERILWSNGQTQESELKGIYTNVDSWHVDVEVDPWEPI